MVDLIGMSRQALQAFSRPDVVPVKPEAPAILGRGLKIIGIQLHHGRPFGDIPAFNQVCVSERPVIIAVPGPAENILVKSRRAVLDAVDVITVQVPFGDIKIGVVESDIVEIIEAPIIYNGFNVSCSDVDFIKPGRESFRRVNLIVHHFQIAEAIE